MVSSSFSLLDCNTRTQQSSPHLKAIPGVGSLAAWRLPRCDFQHLGGQAHRAFHLQSLLLSSLEEDFAHCTNHIFGMSKWYQLQVAQAA